MYFKKKQITLSVFLFVFVVSFIALYFVFSANSNNVNEVEPMVLLSKDEILDGEYGYLYPEISSDYMLSECGLYGEDLSTLSFILRSNTGSLQLIVNKKEDIEYQERLIEIESNNKPLESLHSPIFYDDQFHTQCMKYINCTETKTGFLCWNFSVLTKNKYVAEYIIRTTSLDEAAYMFDAISCCFSN